MQERAAQQAAREEQAAGERQQQITEGRERVATRAVRWWAGCGVVFLIGALFLLTGAEMNSPDHPGTPGAVPVGIGAALITLSLITAAIRFLMMAVGLNFASHPEYSKGSARPWVAAIVACALVTAGGVAVVLLGAPQGGPPGKGATTLGTVLIVAGLAGAAVWAVAGFQYVSRPQRDAYKRWMASLTPAQRTAVYAAQAAGLWGAHEILKHQNRERRQRLAESQRGGTGLPSRKYQS